MTTMRDLGIEDGETPELPLNLRSDNVTGIAPPILDAILRANRGSTASYGADERTLGLGERFSELFGKRCAVQPLGTGTATNALAMSLLTPPWGAIVCSAVSHVHDSECGAAELFTGGAKVTPLPEADGKLAPETLERHLTKAGWGRTSEVQPAVLAIAQATERGTVYQPDEIAALAAIARRHGLKVHLDGARFANALAALGCEPADLTWKAGVDVLSFGGTKNGCLAAEAIVMFDESLAEPLRFRARKAGHIFSKMRFVSAQLEAYVENGLWLRLAAHANAMAARVATGLEEIEGARLLHPVDINEVFMALPDAAREGLKADGFGFYDRGGGTVRLVTAFDTAPEQVDAFVASARRHAAGV
jgi:threonine aldolase